MRTSSRHLLWLLHLVILAPPALPADGQPKRIALIAGKKSHAPGQHEYEHGSRLLKHAIETSPDLKGVRCDVILDGWPRDERLLDEADAIFTFSDGADASEQAHPLLLESRLEVLRRQMRRGCGLVLLHYTLFVPVRRGGPEFLDWAGGFFDYESGEPPRKWLSKIATHATRVSPATPAHPIARGLAPFELREEFYYQMRFRPDDPRTVPILTASIPPGGKDELVAWCVERADGGRGFAFTGGHFHDNWAVEGFRKMMLNAIAWTAKVEVPAKGVASTLPADFQPLPGEPRKSAKAAPGGASIQSLIAGGHNHAARDGFADCDTADEPCRLLPGCCFR
jgi:hypothetical protein